MTSANTPIPGRVVIVGGGVAGVEALLALQALAGDRVDLTLVSQQDWLVDRPMTVAEPFGRGSAARHSVPDIVAERGARFVGAAVVAVDAGEHRVSCTDGTELGFDTLILAPGARLSAPFADAIVFGVPGSGKALGEMVQALRSREARSVAFVAPGTIWWVLPLYELALMTARELARSDVEGVELRLLSPEDRPLALFGDQGSQAAARLLAAAGIEFVGLTVVNGESAPADYVVTLPLLRGPELAGVPAMPPRGFVEVDQHGRATGLADVYAAGDATDFPVKQGGIAAQQADAVAETSPPDSARASTPRRFGPPCEACCSRATPRSTCAPPCPAPTRTFPAPGIRSGGRLRRSPAATSRRICTNAAPRRSSASHPQGSSMSTSRSPR